MAEIKKAAKDGHMDAAKIKAKDLVRTRSYIKKMFKMKSHMEAVSLRLQTMSSSLCCIYLNCRTVVCHSPVANFGAGISRMGSENFFGSLDSSPILLYS